MMKYHAPPGYKVKEVYFDTYLFNNLSLDEAIEYVRKTVNDSGLLNPKISLNIWDSTSFSVYGYIPQTEQELAMAAARSERAKASALKRKAAKEAKEREQLAALLKKYPDIEVSNEKIHTKAKASRSKS